MWAPRLREPRPEAPPVAGRKRRERPCRWREAAEPRTGTAGGNRGPSGTAPGGSGWAVPVARCPALPVTRPRAAVPPLIPVVPRWFLSRPPSFSALLQLLCLLSSYRWVRCPCQVGSSPVLVSGFPVLVSPSLALSSHPGPVVIWALSGVPQHLPQGLWAVGSTRRKSCLLLNVSSLPDTSLLSEC